MRATALLSVGSNVGEREENLREALRRLRDHGLQPERVSGLYETEPIGEAAGPRWFLNAALVAGTQLGPKEALAACLRVESDMGRSRGGSVPRGGPRVIDVDLLALDEVVVSGEELILPHPRMHLRRFVLEPLAEIAPGWRHPVVGKTVIELLGGLRDPARVRRACDFPRAGPGGGSEEGFRPGGERGRVDRQEPEEGS